MEQPGPSSESNDNQKKGLKEESKALGTVQILTGLMILGVGIILACAHDSSYFSPSCSKIVKSGYPFVGGVSFIISGSLSIASEKKKTKSLVRLGLEDSEGLFQLQAQDLPYSLLSSQGPTRFLASMQGTLSVMLIFTGLELSVAVFAAIFSWRRLSVDSNGRVLFLPHGHHINSSLRTALHDPAYEELGAST
uniref:Membrane-spanning 4-domains subfamily A member 6A-like isoform X2 n=1 Tax=Phascolarctos cinereus TaxID=38626 RepID=A0A6P5JL25_PHACI|nr:membrane-spanning 4-domains subfamily A member 6A-like isoform X2 [Phascolarctos cinereus]